MFRFKNRFLFSYKESFRIVAGIIAITAIALLFVWFIPKRLSGKEIYITWWVMSALAVFTDLLLGVAPFDLFDFLQDPKPELLSILVEMTMPAAYGIIFLNFMPMRKQPFVFYLVGFVLLSVFMEWLTVRFGYLIYKGWNLWYSSLVYSIGCLFLRWHLFYIRGLDKTAG